ncbi:hypothetical protein [uncultured Desulfobacter sp.]|uniref:hypothetical protein n=1 Tax=uncultured Desulfobacter sp. TaxID=240139 RepID=UPI0029F59D63|nr:hypothetical protein [uncultured Desulfobacter sp.]
MFESVAGKQTAVSAYVDDARGAVQQMYDIFVALTRIPLSEDFRVKISLIKDCTTAKRCGVDR